MTDAGIQQTVELTSRFDGDFFKKIQLRGGELFVDTDLLEIVDAAGTRDAAERDRKIDRINYFLGKGLVDAFVESSVITPTARSIAHRWRGRIRLTDYGRRFLADIIASVQAAQGKATPAP